jgi:malate dehydrogenase (oxaloacetate-decarboxylating)
MYIGVRQPRVRGDAYWSFVDEFVDAVKKVWPDVLLQWEDFGKNTSFRHLEKHRDRICSFNDDIQVAFLSIISVLSG